MSRWADHPREYATEIARAYREDETINQAETMADDMTGDPMLMVRAIADLDAEVNELTAWKAEAVRKMQQLDELIRTVAGLIERVEKLDTRIAEQERAMLTLARRIRLHRHPLPGRFNTSTSAVDLPAESPPEGS